MTRDALEQRLADAATRERRTTAPPALRARLLREFERRHGAPRARFAPALAVATVLLCAAGLTWLVRPSAPDDAAATAGTRPVETPRAATPAPVYAGHPTNASPRAVASEPAVTPASHHVADAPNSATTPHTDTVALHTRVDSSDARSATTPDTSHAVVARTDSAPATAPPSAPTDITPMAVFAPALPAAPVALRVPVFPPAVPLTAPALPNAPPLENEEST